MKAIKGILYAENIIYVEQIISTVKIPNKSPWQIAEVCQNYCQRNIQRFLQSVRQLLLLFIFSRSISEAN